MSSCIHQTHLPFEQVIWERASAEPVGFDTQRHVLKFPKRSQEVKHVERNHRLSGIANLQRYAARLATEVSVAEHLQNSLLRECAETKEWIIPHIHTKVQVLDRIRHWLGELGVVGFAVIRDVGAVNAMLGYQARSFLAQDLGGSQKLRVAGSKQSPKDYRTSQ